MVQPCIDSKDHGHLYSCVMHKVILLQVRENIIFPTTDGSMAHSAMATSVAVNFQKYRSCINTGAVAAIATAIAPQSYLSQLLKRGIFSAFSFCCCL